MSSIAIQPMTADDCQEVRALWEATEGVGLDASDDFPRLIAYLERNPGLSLVAREGQRIVGAVLCGQDGRRGYLSHLAVDPVYRGRGLGRRLVESCLAGLKATGVLRLSIHVYANNPEGQAFWEHLGFFTRQDVRLMQCLVTG